MEPLAFPLHETDGFQYVDEGPASEVPPIVLLHGMIGAVSNWNATIRTLAQHNYRVIVPVLPVTELPLNQTHIPGFSEFVRAFLTTMDLGAHVLGGNSLGGHVALYYTLKYPSDITALVLTGSAGIREREVGTMTPRRRDRSFIRERAAMTFYDPTMVTESLVDFAYDLLNDRKMVLRLIRVARSTQSDTLTDRLGEINVPTQLIWGQDDQITPPDVAEEFKALLPQARLAFIDQCGHAPMMEHPDAFNEIMLAFLRQIIGTPVLASSTNGAQTA